MKKLMISALAILCFTGYALEATAASYCSNATLKGTYLYSGQGAQRGQIKAYLETGMETYDGMGKVVNMYSNSESLTTNHDTGTYVVNGNCSGTVKYSSGTVLTIFVNPTGGNFTYIQTNVGDKLLSGEEKRVSTKAILSVN